MRLSRRSEPFDSDDFIYELKIDGFRALAHLKDGRGELVSRNGNTFRGFAEPNPREFVISRSAVQVRSPAFPYQ
jgi:hypothetical protein